MHSLNVYWMPTVCTFLGSEHSKVNKIPALTKLIFILLLLIQVFSLRQPTHFIMMCINTIFYLEKLWLRLYRIWFSEKLQYEVYKNLLMGNGEESFDTLFLSMKVFSAVTRGQDNVHNRLPFIGPSSLLACKPAARIERVFLPY